MKTRATVQLTWGWMSKCSSLMRLQSCGWRDTSLHSRQTRAQSRSSKVRKCAKTQNRTASRASRLWDRFARDVVIMVRDKAVVWTYAITRLTEGDGKRRSTFSAVENAKSARLTFHLTHFRYGSSIFRRCSRLVQTDRGIALPHATQVYGAREKQLQSIFTETWYMVSRKRLTCQSFRPSRDFGLKSSWGNFLVRCTQASWATERFLAECEPSRKTWLHQPMWKLHEHLSQGWNRFLRSRFARNAIPVVSRPCSKKGRVSTSRSRGSFAWPCPAGGVRVSGQVSSGCGAPKVHPQSRADPIPRKGLAICKRRAHKTDKNKFSFGPLKLRTVVRSY